MTIKEIAKLSNTSISTGSKSLNGKDQSISRETREKVLQIAREYHYIPYESVVKGSRFILGVVVSDTEKGKLLLSGINRAARKAGYGIFCCEYSDEPDSEKKAVTAVCAQNIPAVLWQRQRKESSEYLSYFESKNIQVFFCDFWQESGAQQFTLDYGRYGYEAARYLVDRYHYRIGCCIRKQNEASERFVKGFRRCMYDNGLEIRSDFLMEWEESRAFSEISVYGITALVCLDEEIAADICRKAAASGYRVPADLSILAVSDSRKRRILYPKITGLYLPVEELGEYACRSVIAGLEKSGCEKEEFRFEILEGDSAGAIPDKRARKILVVGSINMDSVISVKSVPEAGDTCIADELYSFAGGKGFNQAVGAAELGAQVSLIGKIGQDYEGKVLRDAMAEYGLNVDGVMESPVGGTGKAFITVQKNGESNIIVYAGANRYLTKEDIQRNSHLFARADYCLLQLETPVEIVEYVAHMAKRQEIRVILKPSAVSEVSEELLGQIDIFVPNRKEADHLCPEGRTLEEKGAFFLKKGVKEVIITLDEQGCFWMNEKERLYFEPARFEAVDTTGAADAFISALAVYLAEGFPMVTAIQYATYAAGFSITRNGVQSAMVERQTMDAYAEQIVKTIRYGRCLYGSEKGN